MSLRVPTWWRAHQQQRRPVSRRRRWFSLTLLALALLAAATYHYLTDRDRLRRFAEHWLEEFSGGEARIEDVRFNLFRGLNLIGVTLATPASLRFDAHDNSLEARTIFRSDTVFLQLRPLSVVTGTLVVPEIVAVNPELRLVHRTSDGLGNWEVMFARRHERPADQPPRLPVIRLRDAWLRQYRLDEHGYAGGSPQAIWADARPSPDDLGVYEVTIAKFLAFRDGDAGAGDVSRITVDMRTLAVAGSLPSMPIDELLFAAPAEVIRWLDILALRGHVRADTFQFDPRAGSQATLALRDAKLSIPIDERERDRPAEKRYVQFDGVSGTITFDRHQAQADLAGRFRESRVAIQGRLTLPQQQPVTLADIGFDVTLSAWGVPLPRQDAQADPAEVRFVRRWERLEDFVRWYDGAGHADVQARLHKATGPDKGIEFVEGTLELAGDVSAAYHRFPYRLHNGRGKVHFRRDGKVELVDLRGEHGSGRVVLNGLQGGWSSQELDLKIHAEDIDLDGDLLSCLSQADQELCRMFNASARLNLDVHLRRRHAPPDTRGNPVLRDIDVTFLDGGMTFERFPYPLTGLSGRMRIAGRALQIDGLRARRGDTVVEVRGWADRPEDSPVRLLLEVTAAAVPLDDVLAAALPERARRLYQRWARAGQAHVTGRVFTGPQGGPVRYDLSASLCGAELALPGGRQSLTQVEAALHVVPEQLVVESLHGLFHDSPVTLDGRIGMTEQDSALALNLQCEQLPLDEALCEVLPPAVSAAWEAFQPNGRVRLDLRYARWEPAVRHAASMPSAEAPEPAEDYAAVIEPIDCQATFSRFPLPLTEINGRLRVTPGLVSIEQIAARHQETTFHIAGNVRFSEAITSGELAVQAENLPFSEPLRRAVPWRMRRLWNDARPRGRLDVGLDRMAFTIVPGSPTAWSFQGRASLSDMAIALGPTLTDIQGQLALRGEIGPRWSLDGELALNQVRLDGRLVTDLRARLARAPGDSTFRVEDLTARFCEGTMIGRTEVDYAPGGPTFAVSLTARDIALQQFLNARRKPEDKPITMQGRVGGRFSVTGRIGDPRTRRGDGGILIREAQMLKVPLLLAILQVIHFAIDDDNAFHDATVNFTIDGDTLVLDEIDLRGKALSMVGAGRVHTPTQRMDLALLVGSPLRLPRIEVLTELLEGVARELMEVHVEGTLDKPTFRAEIVGSARRALEALFTARGGGEPLR